MIVEMKRFRANRSLLSGILGVCVKHAIQPTGKSPQLRLCSVMKGIFGIGLLLFISALVACGGAEETDGTDNEDEVGAQCASMVSPINLEGSEPDAFEGDGDVFVSIDEAWAAYEQGQKFIILDARPPSDYVMHHIEGAISIPFYDVDDCYAGLPKDVWIMTYCACPHNESVHAAETLLENGFTKVRVLNEGYIEWRNRDYPTSDNPTGEADAGEVDAGEANAGEANAGE